MESKYNAARLLGRLGGQKTSPLKKKSSRTNGALGGRPSKILTCFETARRCKNGEDWKIAFFEFIDAFRTNPSFRLLERDPSSLKLEENLYALLQSICISLCKEQRLKTAGWLMKSAFLKEPWFVSGVNNLRATALQESPASFRMNNIFVLGNFLNRV